MITGIERLAPQESPPALGFELRKLLLIEDNPPDARLIYEMLREHTTSEIEFVHVSNMSAAEAFLGSQSADAILLDLGLPDAVGMDAIRRVRAAASRTPLVVLTGNDDETMASDALHGGAQDYLIKGQIESRGLIRALRYAIERNRIEETLFHERERAEVTLASIGDAVVCTDARGNITFMNAASEAMTGWLLADAQGAPPTQVLQFFGQHATHAPAAGQCDGAGPMVSTSPNRVLMQKNGSLLPVLDTSAPILDRDGNPAGAVVVFRDVTVARALGQQTTFSAEHDFLTGLPNRMLLDDRIHQAIARAPRNENSVALLFLDLDGFKGVNDSLGHPVGDKLLQQVANRLEKCVRTSDTVSRQGGDEFVVLLSEVAHSEDAAVTATRILRAIAEPYFIEENELHLTASIGVSVYPDDGLDAETLTKNADTAMYQAKENGRQSYRFFRPEMNARAVERQFIEESLRTALGSGELALVYHPKVDLRTNRVTGAEALIRWTHPTRGNIPAEEFMPIAESSRLSLPLGTWLLREACTRAREWFDAGFTTTPVMVNISALQFRDGSFVDRVFAILEETGLPPAMLELELTESVLMNRVESTTTILKALRSRGVRIAIDEFGTGYSSLNYLRQFPVDALKIDQSFIRSISDGSDSALVAAVIDLARSLRLRVVAEGVETLDEVEFLRSRNCDEAQGYFFSPPVSAEALGALMERGCEITTVARSRIVELQGFDAPVELAEAV